MSLLGKLIRALFWSPLLEHLAFEHSMVSSMVTDMQAQAFFCGSKGLKTKLTTTMPAAQYGYYRLLKNLKGKRIMALMDFIRKQFIDIIQWTEDDDGTTCSGLIKTDGPIGC